MPTQYIISMVEHGERDELYLTKTRGFIPFSIFNRCWVVDYAANIGVIDLFSSFSHAELYLQTEVNNTPSGHIWRFDFFINECQIMVNPTTFHPMLKLGKKTNYIHQNISAPTIPSSNNNISQPTPDASDDIDYDTPGETLKAYKLGKKVDWKKKAKRS